MFGTFRTFLALMVVALHLGGYPKIGAYAVFGFYCLSGYLMTFIMQNTYGYTLLGRAKYATNRFLRIYPIYWFSVLFSIILIWLFGENFVSNYHKAIFLPDGFIETAKNIFLFFPFRNFPRLTPPAWALTVELFFYLLIGIGLSKNRRITILWFILSISYHLVISIFQLGWVHKYFTIFAASLPFSTGAMIFHYQNELIKYSKKLSGDKEVFLPFCLAVFFLANWKIGIILDQSDGLFFYSNYLLCAIMIVTLLDKKRLPFINKKIDKIIGDFSYPIYLIHYQAGILVVMFFSIFGIELKRPDPTLMLASIPVIIFLSWIITITLEKPIELLRSKIKS